ncbi:MAG: PepSY domain-containing protein, partial [Porphyromonadaceae bacterium]|nr:PepSY domain-containing protein [Porphyromonadaceae bacterium]
TNIRITKDSDDGVSVYDVEFYIGTKEYDYEIDASNGTIRSQDTDIENDFLNSSSNNTDSSVISQEEAAKIVLAKVEGATEQHLRIKLDTDDGQQIYEGEIHYDGMEYEFELNAKTGDVLEWSKEREDD